MSNKDKGKAVEGAASGAPRLGEKIDDPPPPYTPFKPNSDRKPPPLPAVPPAIIRDAPPDTRPRITDRRGLRITDYTTSRGWEGCKSVCCTASCWSWMKR